MTAQCCLVAEDIDIVAGSEQQEASGLPHYDDVIDAATTTTTTAQTPPSPAPESSKPKSKLHNNMLSALRKIGSDRESKKLRRDDVRRGRPGADSTHDAGGGGGSPKSPKHSSSNYSGDVAVTAVMSAGTERTSALPTLASQTSLPGHAARTPFTWHHDTDDKVPAGNGHIENGANGNAITLDDVSVAVVTRNSQDTETDVDDLETHNTAL